METVEELFITGSRLEQFYKDPDDYYQEVLKRDPTNIRTNTALGNQYLKNGDYKTARKYFSTAIHRITTDYVRPKDAEALYLQGITLKALGLYDDAKDTLYRATWDQAYHSAAYFELAQISSIKGDYKKALDEVNESLSTNARNSRAIGLKASLERKLGDYDVAEKILSAIMEKDPLNFRISNEYYLLSKASGKIENSKSALASFTKKARNFNENYLELAVDYLNDGMLSEAQDVLERYEGEDPIIEYYLGYIQDKLGNKQGATKHFQQAQRISIDYTFPYRLETVKVLNRALDYNPKDGKVHYYLGNILYNKQPELAMDHWQKAVDNNQDLAMAYRNLGWGYYRHYDELQKAISYYEKAIALDGNNAIFYTELDNLYELNNSPVKNRLELFEGKEKVVNNRDDAFVRQITVLTLAGKPEEAVRLLKDKSFSYREGSSRVREVIIDAQLSLGLKLMHTKEYKKALEHFLMAQVPDEEAGSARSGNRDIQVNYFIGTAYAALNEIKKAKEYYNLAVQEATSNRSGIMNYYQGMSYLELNNETQAEIIFNNLIKEGDKMLNNKNRTTGDFFAIFGESESGNTKKSRAYTLTGLGNKGLGNLGKAKEDLTKAVALSVSNLWATNELY